MTNIIISIQDNSFAHMYCVIQGEVGVYSIDEENKGTLARIIKQNSYFGEQCLSARSDQKWEYICQSPECILIAIQRCDLKQLFNSIKKQDIMDSLSFLSTLSAFSQYNSNLLFQIFCNSTPIQYQRNNFVFYQGDESNYVYIIKSGHFLVQSSLGESSSQQFKSVDIVTAGNDAPKSQSKVLLKKKLSTKEQKIVVWGEKEIFGEEDVLEGRQRRYSISCESTEGELIRISKDYFLSHIMQEETSKNIILDYLAQKLTLLELKHENAMKQLYESDLARYYRQKGVQSTVELPSNRFIDTDKDNTSLTSISNPKNISFKTLIKSKLIRHDTCSDSSTFTMIPNKDNHNQSSLLPNISPSINSTSIFNLPDSTFKTCKTNHHQSEYKLNKQSNNGISLRHITRSIGYTSQLTNNYNPVNNKINLIHKHNNNYDDQQDNNNNNNNNNNNCNINQNSNMNQNNNMNQNERSKSQNQIENMDYELVGRQSREQLVDLQNIDNKQQKSNNFNKDSIEMVQMKQDIKQRGILQLIKADSSRDKNIRNTAYQASGAISTSTSLSPIRQKNQLQNELESTESRRVRNIIKNVILKGDVDKFNQFRSQQMNIDSQFLKLTSSLANIQDCDSNTETHSFNFNNVECIHENTTAYTQQSSIQNSPQKKILSLSLQRNLKKVSEISEHQKYEVEFLDDSNIAEQKCWKSQQDKQMMTHTQLEQIIELATKVNKQSSSSSLSQLSFSQQAQKIQQEYDLCSAVKSKQNKPFLIQQDHPPHKGLSPSYHLYDHKLPTNSSLNASPIKQRANNNFKQFTSPFTENLLKKYYIMKQRTISPKKQHAYSKSQSISIQQLKNELHHLDDNIHLNNERKNVKFTDHDHDNDDIHVQTNQTGILVDESYNHIQQDKKIKSQTFSKSLIQYSPLSISPNINRNKSNRNIRQLNVSETPISSKTKQCVKYINFSETCQQIQNDCLNEKENSSSSSSFMKGQTERGCQSMNNIFISNKKQNVHSQQSAININHSQTKSVSPLQKKQEDKVNSTINHNKQMQNQQNIIQSHFENIKQNFQEQQCNPIQNEKDNIIISQRKVKTERTPKYLQLTERNQHFSITNRFFDQLEKKKINGLRPSAAVNSSQNGNNYLTSTQVSAAAAKIILQKRVISNVGNSSILNSLDLSKLKKSEI